MREKSPLNIQIGYRVREIRMQAGLSQEELGWFCRLNREMFRI